ncbi:MAG: hypothetical protein RL318_2844 [Fibrobacterota bacterium]|jgi:hypothetical protein
MIELVPYEEGLREIWDRIVRGSRNGHFFFLRDYLDYHLHRFPNASYLFRKDGEWLGIVSGHTEGSHDWSSHSGLTYGGIVLSSQARTVTVLDMFRALNRGLCERGIQKAWYKPLPWFHHEEPSQEAEYAMFRLGAHLESRTVTTLVSAGEPELSQLRRRKARKAAKDGVTCGRSQDLASFWPLVEGRLSSRFGVRPAHTLEEMQLLMARFPGNIEFYAATNGDAMLSGCLVLRNPQVLHMQYLHSTEEGREGGASDLLIEWIVREATHPCRWFCLGQSGEDGGKRLNEGLLAFKEGFGGRCATYDEYSWEPEKALL